MNVLFTFLFLSHIFLSFICCPCFSRSLYSFLYSFFCKSLLATVIFLTPSTHPTELLDRGNLLHGCIQSELSGITPLVEEMPTIQGMWTSLRTVLPNVSDVRVLESRLIHPYLHYQGALDCVGLYRYV